MQDLALYIIKQLVNNPDDVSIEETNSGQGEVTLIVSVNPDDMGIIIGKSGQTIKAVRRILSIRAMNDNVRVNLQLAEPEGSVRPEKRQSEEEDEGQSEKEQPEVDSEHSEEETSSTEEKTDAEDKDNSKKDEA